MKSKRLKKKGMLKFAHLSDCHLGAWRQPELQELSVKSFQYAIDFCIREKVKFVLITGDLFDNALPSVDILKDAADKLRELKENNIDCFVIPGSHDYSISGKTFLDVFEKSGLFVNVAKHSETDDSVNLELFENDYLCLAGVAGKKAGLERNLISKIKQPEIKNSKLKILALHTTLSEAKPKGMDFVESTDAKNLPGGFDYYAFGHLHEYFNKTIDNKTLVYPGPLFPANFTEFEELGCGSFCIVIFDNRARIEKKDISLKRVLCLGIDANGKTPEQTTQDILNNIKDINDKIIVMRIFGVLSEGKTSDLDFSKINEVSSKNSNILLKNTSNLTSPEFKTDIESSGKDIHEIEKEIIEKNEKKEIKSEFTDFNSKIEQLIHSLDIEKQDGETNPTFEKRIMDEMNKIFGI